MHTGDQEGDGTGLLEGVLLDTNTNTHVHELFHEDAQVRCVVAHKSLAFMKMEVKRRLSEYDDAKDTRLLICIILKQPVL